MKLLYASHFELCFEKRNMQQTWYAMPKKKKLRNTAQTNAFVMTMLYNIFTRYF